MTQLNRQDHCPPTLANALPVLTNVAHDYWAAADGRVELEELLELGMTTLLHTIDHSSFDGSFYSDLVASLHAAMRELTELRLAQLEAQEIACAS